MFFSTSNTQNNLLHTTSNTQNNLLHTTSNTQNNLLHTTSFTLTVCVAPRNITCWMHHLKLGPLQADPPNVKLRAATGFDAADYLLANYWVWAKLLENLAMIGYDAWHILESSRCLLDFGTADRDQWNHSSCSFLLNLVLHVYTCSWLLVYIWLPGLLLYNDISYI